MEEPKKDGAAFICSRDTLDGAYPHSSLDELLEMAQIEGVELIVCRMTLDMMEIDERELIEGRAA
jgi:peroxiredoxin family protein